MVVVLTALSVGAYASLIVLTARLRDDRGEEVGW